MTPQVQVVQTLQFLNVLRQTGDGKMVLSWVSLSTYKGVQRSSLLLCSAATIRRKRKQDVKDVLDIISGAGSGAQRAHMARRRGERGVARRNKND